MKKIESYIGVAQKVSGTGEIKYSLWVNKSGSLFIQLIDNDASGTFSNHVFSIQQYESIRHSIEKFVNLEAYDVKNGKKIKADDNNNGAFLKAALIHLLD